MEKKNILRRTGIFFGTGIAVFMAVIAALMCVDVIDTLAKNELKEATSCTFVIPPEFVPGNEKGQVINKNYPMESSSVQYSYYDNGLDVPLTNRQKESVNQDEALKVAEEAQNLTKEKYQKTISDAYNSAFGHDVGFEVSSFDKITIDGYPGYKIVTSFKVSDDETVHQTVYMLLSRYRTFTVTYQRASDDDCEVYFDESAATIHVY